MKKKGIEASLWKFLYFQEAMESYFYTLYFN